MKSQSKFIHFHPEKCIWKCCLENGCHFVSLNLHVQGLATSEKNLVARWAPQTLNSYYPPLTHWGQVMQICVRTTYQHWHVTWSAPSHYLNQCWNIVNWILGNKFQWNFHWNRYIFFQENVFENIVCKMASISSRPQGVECMLLWPAIRPQISITIRNFADFSSCLPGNLELQILLPLGNS